MAERHEHCAFAQLNEKKRCIAICWRNAEEVGQDCVGNKGSSSQPCPDHPDWERRKI